jgi:oligopeptide transport system permease protein
LVERLLWVQQVVGSNPAALTFSCDLPGRVPPDSVLHATSPLTTEFSTVTFPRCTPSAVVRYLLHSMARNDSDQSLPKTRKAPPEPQATIPAIMAPRIERDNPLTRSFAGMAGAAFLILMFAACVLTLPWTLGDADGVPRYNEGSTRAGRLPPMWWGPDTEQQLILNSLVPLEQVEQIAAELNEDPIEIVTQTTGRAADRLRALWPGWLLGTDVLGRSLWVRVLAGGGISLGVGIAAALLSVFIGTVYGAISGYVGGKVDGVMMRIVDILYGLPYILLVVLLAVAVDGFLDQQVANGLVLSDSERTSLDLLTLLVAIGGVSWLTMARVIRGQVLSLKNQPFVEAARASGAGVPRIFLQHLLPNLLGPIIVYATLTVPQAMLQESFLSFLGIGVQPPLPSWGNLAADGLSEINTYKSHWWLLLFPCLLLGITLLALNFVGEGLREAFDPRRARR